MKSGDMIRATASCEKDPSCYCFFCARQCSRIGLIIERLSAVDTDHSDGYWSVMFDAGEWRLYGTDMEVINSPDGEQ